MLNYKHLYFEDTEAETGPISITYSKGKTKNTGMVILNGESVIDPSVIEWGLSDISGANAGRDEKGTMHPMKIGQKRQYKLEWNHIDPYNAQKILKAVNSSETFTAELYDPINGCYMQRTYYVGDRSAPFKIWRPSTVNGSVDKTKFNELDSAIFTKISFTIIEV